MIGELKINSSNNKIFEEGQVFPNAEYSQNEIAIRDCSCGETVRRHRITGVDCIVFKESLQISGHLPIKNKRGEVTYWRKILATLTQK